VTRPLTFSLLKWRSPSTPRIEFTSISCHMTDLKIRKLPGPNRWVLASWTTAGELKRGGWAVMADIEGNEFCVEGGVVGSTPVTTGPPYSSGCHPLTDRSAVKDLVGAGGLWICPQGNAMQTSHQGSQLAAVTERCCRCAL